MQQGLQRTASQAGRERSGSLALNLRVISLVLIVVGITIEFATSGSQIGNLIAGVGIAGYVYDFFKRRQRRQCAHPAFHRP